MTDLDDRIRRALRESDDATLADLAEEPGLFDQVLQTFRSRNRGIIFMTMAAGVVFMALTVFSIIRIFGTEEVRHMILWALAAVFGFSAVLGMKIWYWMELQRNAIARDLKRLELRILRHMDA